MALHRYQQTSRLVLSRPSIARESNDHHLNFRFQRLISVPATKYSTQQLKQFNYLNKSIHNQLITRSIGNQSFSKSTVSQLINQSKIQQTRSINSHLDKKEMSSESDQELTEQQAEELFKKKPAHLIIRKYDGQDTVYLRLLYKYKYSAKGSYKIRDKIFSFQRNSGDLLKAFVDRLKLNVAKHQMIAKKGKNKDDDKSASKTTVQKMLDFRIIHETDGDLLVNNSTLNDLFNYDENTLKLFIDGHQYDVYINPQFIASCKLPKVVLNNFEIFPLVQIDFKKSELEPLYGWYKKIDRKMPQYFELKQQGKLQNGMLLLGDQPTYTPSDEDVGNELKFKIQTRLTENQILETYEVVTRKVMKSPNYFPFEKRHEFTSNRTSENEFRIVSYNILADMYSDSKTAREELFKHCPTQFLTMDYRKHLLAKELLGYNADLICLQEVDSKIFENHLEPIFKMKTRLAGLVSLKHSMDEGCAIFYNQDKFRLVDRSDLKISELIKKDCFKELNEQIEKNFQLNGRFTVRPNILQTAAFECLENNDKIVLLFNTHFYFHPDSDHIRLLQACLILKEIEDQVNKYSTSHKTVVPVIAGDFNSCPEFGVYKLFTQGKISENIEDWKSCESEFIENFSFESKLKFISTYGCPEYTNYTELFSGCLDYIFINPNQLEIKSIVPLIPHEEVIAFKAIPCKNIPSDHIALVATLKFV